MNGANVSGKLKPLRLPSLLRHYQLTTEPKWKENAYMDRTWLLQVKWPTSPNAAKDERIRPSLQIVLKIHPQWSQKLHYCWWTKYVELLLQLESLIKWAGSPELLMEPHSLLACKYLYLCFPCLLGIVDASDAFSIHMNIPEMSPYIPSISEDIIVLTKAFLSNKCCRKASCPIDCGHIQPWLNSINFSEVMTGINMDLFLAPQAFCTFKSIRCHWSQYRICKSPIRSADLCYHCMEEP